MLVFLPMPAWPKAWTSYELLHCTARASGKMPYDVIQDLYLGLVTCISISLWYLTSFSQVLYICNDNHCRRGSINIICIVAAPGCPVMVIALLCHCIKKNVIAASIRLKSMVSCTKTYFNTYTEPFIKKKCFFTAAEPTTNRYRKQTTYATMLHCILVIQKSWLTSLNMHYQK